MNEFRNIMNVLLTHLHPQQTKNVKNFFIMHHHKSLAMAGILPKDHRVIKRTFYKKNQKVNNVFQLMNIQSCIGIIKLKVPEKLPATTNCLNKTDGVELVIQVFKF